MLRQFGSVLNLVVALAISSSAPAQDKKLTTINLGYSAISGSFAPLWVGFDQGFSPSTASISRWPTSRATE
jgi:hypothetical protein